MNYSISNKYSSKPYYLLYAFHNSIFRLERVEEECAALKDKLNILTTVHKKHVQAFKETLNKQNENAVQKLNEILT